MENNKKFRPDPRSKLMDQARQVLRYHHYAYRTEQAYCDWIVRYIVTVHGFKGLGLRPSGYDPTSRVQARPGLRLVAYPPACKSYGLEAASESAT